MPKGVQGTTMALAALSLLMQRHCNRLASPLSLVPSLVWAAHLHGVGFASPCLAICKDCAIEALQDLFHDGRDCVAIKPLLPGVWTKHLHAHNAC